MKKTLTQKLREARAEIAEHQARAGSPSPECSGSQSESEKEG
jgi:hypothetical protein